MPPKKPAKAGSESKAKKPGSTAKPKKPGAQVSSSKAIAKLRVAEQTESAPVRAELDAANEAVEDIFTTLDSYNLADCRADTGGGISRFDFRGKSGNTECFLLGQGGINRELVQKLLRAMAGVWPNANVRVIVGAGQQIVEVG